MGASFFVLRKLTGSELGWFAEPRARGKARGRQRGINFNAADMKRIFPPELLESGDIPVVSRRLSDGQEQSRRIRFQEKNWRLVGDKVSGTGLEVLAVGDFFWAEIQTAQGPPFSLVWDVVTAASNLDLHNRVDREFSVFLNGGMASWSGDDPMVEYVASIVGLHIAATDTKNSEEHAEEVSQKAAKTQGSPEPSETGDSREPSKAQPSQPFPRPRRKRIEDKLRRPHILTEIVKVGMALSANAQANFMDVLDGLSITLRTLLLESDLIRKVEINHGRIWEEFRGKRIGFVDGGIANVADMGSAPLAIRVGSYVVTPGDTGPDREEFNFEIQLVDDLYESTPEGEGVYEDGFEDVAKLRDVARICAETGGVLSLALRDKSPEVIFLHGPLVNPVSPYGLEGFPNFTNATIAKLLPGARKRRSGRDANFIAVHLEQLSRLQSGGSTVAGVVERPSTGSPVVRLLIERMHEDERIDAKARREFIDKLQGYRITDSVIFECILDAGEYLEPAAIDKQAPESKIPAAWYPVIKSYPKPLTTYAKAHAETMPIRVEAFANGLVPHSRMMTLVIHMSRLLPRYSFPVGLDIVDKHAKIPEWMSRQMNAMLAAQLMRKAMDTGNPAAVRVVRRILSANTRDWLFRPDFRKGWVA